MALPGCPVTVPPMRITYDPAADAAYLYLVEGATPVARTFDTGMEGVHLDVAGDGTLLGLEVLSASTRLDPELLAAAERI